MSAPREAAASTGLRTALWLLLGGWVGAWACFGLLVAPTAFRVLPSTALAGELVGPILAGLHLYGAAAGIGLAGLAWALRRSAPLAALPVGLALLCLFSHFGVTPRIDEVRALAFGPGGSAKMAARWRELHRLSVGIFCGVGAGTLLLLALHARADAREAGDWRPPLGEPPPPSR